MIPEREVEQDLRSREEAGEDEELSWPPARRVAHPRGDLDQRNAGRQQARGERVPQVVQAERDAGLLLGQCPELRQEFRIADNSPRGTACKGSRSKRDHHSLGPARSPRAPRESRERSGRPGEDQVVALRPVGEVLAGVVDHVVGAEGADKVHLIRAADARDVRSEHLRELQRERADTSRCTDGQTACPA